MGRAPCCSKVGLNRGRWTAEEDELLIKYIETHGEGCWRALPQNAGLLRCGKSCRLRWINYLRADVKRGNISAEEEELIIKLHCLLGNRWSLIAGRMPGRTDNEIKNYWNTHLSRKLARRGVDPVTHEPITNLSAGPSSKPFKTRTRDGGKRRQKMNQTQGGIVLQTKAEETPKSGASKKLRARKKPEDKSFNKGLQLASSNKSRPALQRRNVEELEGLDQPLNSSAISVNSSVVNPSSCESSCSKLDSWQLVTVKSCKPGSFDETQFLLGNSWQHRGAAAPEASFEEVLKETYAEDVMVGQDDQYPCTATAFTAESRFTDSIWDYSFSSHLLLSEMELFGSEELFGCLLPSNAESTRESFAVQETTPPQGDPDDPWPSFLSNIEASYPAS